MLLEHSKGPLGPHRSETIRPQLPGRETVALKRHEYLLRSLIFNAQILPRIIALLGSLWITKYHVTYKRALDVRNFTVNTSAWPMEFRRLSPILHAGSWQTLPNMTAQTSISRVPIVPRFQCLCYSRSLLARAVKLRKKGRKVSYPRACG